MRSRTLLSILLFLLIFNFGCTKLKPVVTDKKSTDARLLTRINAFQSGLISKDFDAAGEIELPDNEYGSNVKEYINSFREGGHMAEYFKVDYKILDTEAIGEKAKSRIKYFITDKEGSVPQEAILVNFWVFKNDDWFFYVGGKDEMFQPKNWW